ncbi:MAG: TonB-dependent siderophore receptor [Paraglaciecola sp.]|uniref:TonB-dependent siderophore receptor n=1 Tax=Paraglaciecola sp. TaxID=1920173 RepID=UPI0032968AA1
MKTGLFLPSPRKLAFSISLILSANVLAQESKDEAKQSSDEMEIIRVNAYKPAHMIEAATKTTTPLIETPQSVAVIDRAELDARGVNNLNEAARYTAGVLPESQGIDNRVDDLYIRGFNAGSFSNNVMLDGLRAPSDGSNSWNRTTFNSWNLQQVEVLKGPSGVLYGQISPGGFVNQVSKLPQEGLAQVTRFGADNNGRLQAAFDFSGGETQNSLWRLVGMIGDGDTQIDEVEHQQWFIAPSTSFGFNSGDTKLTLLGIYQKDNGGSTFQFYPYQGSVIPAAEGYIGNSTFLGEPDWNTYDRMVWSAGWLFSHKLNDTWSLEQSARFTHVDSLYQTTVGYGVRGASVENVNNLVDGRILGRRAVQGLGDSDAQTIDTRLHGNFNTGELKHALLFGVDYQKTDWDFHREMAVVDPDAIAIDVFAPEYSYFDFASILQPQISTVETDKQTGLYIQDQLAFNNWRITLGGRYDDYTIESTNRLNQDLAEVEEDAFTGRGGISYLLGKEFVPYVSYSESFQPATGTDRSGNTFKPVTGSQWEAGLKYAPDSIEGMVTVSLFDLRQQNILTSDPLNESDEIFQIQSGEAKIVGFELEGRVTPKEGISIIGAATRFSSKLTKDNDGNQGNRMSRVPDWTVSLWMDYEPQFDTLTGLSVALGGRYVGQSYGDLANTLDIDSYSLIDAALRYDFGEFNDVDVKFAFNASNLTNKRYVATCSALTACYYGSGRKLDATLTLSW